MVWRPGTSSQVLSQEKGIMECRYAINANCATHPEEVMSGSLKEAPGYDFRNIMQYGGDPMSVPGELSRPSTLLFDMVQARLQASQKLATLNYVSCYSEFATSSKSYAASSDSRSPEETDILIFRPPVDEFGDNLGYSRSSSVGTLRPLLDQDLKTAQLTASKVAEDQGILHFQRKGEEAAVTELPAELVMEKILRDHFQDASQSNYHLHKAPTNSSVHIPTSTVSDIKELEFRPLLESTQTSSAQTECEMNPEPSPSGLPDGLSEHMAASVFTSVRPDFRRPVEVTYGGQFKTNNRKWQQQRPSAGGHGAYQSPSPSSCATSSGGFKSKTRSRVETDAVELRAASKPKRRRNQITKGDSSGETQRMTHIAVERNRRKQMNDHLAALKALMPSAFVQKTDQASIIGGAVEFVKELEVLLQSLLSMQRRRTYAGHLGSSWTRLRSVNPGPVLCIAPPYSTPSILPARKSTSEGLSNRLPERRRMSSEQQLAVHQAENASVTAEVKAECKSAVATVEVKVLGNDAIINITTHCRAKQLVKVIVAVEGLDLSILHASITTSKSTVLYTFHAKVGAQCRMTVNQVAATLHQTFNGLSYTTHA